MSESAEFNEKYVPLAISLKVNQLKRELPSITYEHVDFVLKEQWKLKRPQRLHEIISEIQALNASIVVAYLSTYAVIQGSKMKLDDFDDLFS